jgi:hypothetical protein
LAAARQAQGSRSNGAKARNHFSSKIPLPDSGLIAFAPSCRAGMAPSMERRAAEAAGQCRQETVPLPAD